MEIVWLGHSAVRLRSVTTTLVTDPYPPGLGISMGSQKADIVTISNRHPHHAFVQGLEGEPKVVNGPGEYEISNFYITGIGTPRSQDPMDREVNTIYVFHAEGLTLCHLGDLGRPLTPRQVEELGQPDVLFVPAGGVCTLEPARMVETVRLIQPAIVVPIHYGLEGLEVELGPVDEFLRALEASDVVTPNRLNVTTNNVPRQLRVAILNKA